MGTDTDTDPEIGYDSTLTIVYTINDALLMGTDTDTDPEIGYD